MRALPPSPIITSADVGRDLGTPVSEEYAAKMPFEYPGKIEKVTIELVRGELSEDNRKRLRELEHRAAFAIE
ncbi:MAG TPA: hypothetical protein VGF18_04965 [Candidatus Tumulicola sp.]|jgi:hypothetical protein